jgi:hypothetical protein
MAGATIQMVPFEKIPPVTCPLHVVLSIECVSHNQLFVETNVGYRLKLVFMLELTPTLRHLELEGDI